MELKKGYTTGTCATISTKACLKMLFEKKIVDSESIITPKGIKIECKILNPEIKNSSVSCAVRKYSGDDPDVTNGILIYSKVSLKQEREIIIDGGIGVGRITKNGLQQKIGEPAINKVPKQMITDIVKSMLDEYSYYGGAEVIISVPEGEEIAKKTFNPRLGIVGGISILGTSGIVEPMSEQAIIDTIKVEMNMKRANEGDSIMIAPGNYGIDFIKNEFDVNLDKAVKCSNFIGEALDFAVKDEFKNVLLIGHIGKFIKIAGGIMNTHSRNADARMEILASNSALFCDDIQVVRKIMDCITTDDAIKILKENNILEKVMQRIIDRIIFYVNHRTRECLNCEVIMFSNEFGILGESENAKKIISIFRD